MSEQKKRGRPAKKDAPKQEKPRKAPDKMMEFAAEYIIDWNATRAYKTVYGSQLSDETAAPAGSRLTRNSKVIDEIERLLQSRRDRRAERRARVIDELEKIAYDDLETDAFRDKDGNVIGVSRKDRVKALELLGKTEAMFTDKVEQTGPIDISVNFNPKGV